MLATIRSGAILGVDAYPVRVEVDLARGLPSMTVVGLPQGAVREGRDRVTAALANSGYEVPPRRITINLAPADIPKSGSAFDLPIAVGILAAAKGLRKESLGSICLLGELGLDGGVRPVQGALAVALHCRKTGIRSLIVPASNVAEAAVVEGVEVHGAKTLREVVAHLDHREMLPVGLPGGGGSGIAREPSTDFSDVRGQETARRALEIGAAGGHNLLMVCRCPRARTIPSWWDCEAP